MRKILFILMKGALLLCLISCNNDDKTKDENTPYDPAKPVEVKTFMPDAGELREKFIIKGSNFGTDISKIKVYFIDNTAERSATIIGANSNTIYCLAPRQLPGDNLVKVVVDGKEVLTDKKFKYSQAENVSTIVGTTNDRKTLDGSLSVARTNRISGVAAIGNEAVIIFQGFTDFAVRLVSVPDNTVTTLQSGFAAGKPTVTKDKQTVYAIGKESPHTIYRYSKGTGWASMRVGQLGTDYSTIWACALDKTEEWLYFIDIKKKFARYNIKSQEINIISSSLDIQGNGSIFLVYHPIQDCFYVSATEAYSIYKLQKDGAISLFSGSSNEASSIDGPIADARYHSPQGLTVDEDGNIYVVQAWHDNHLIRKIIIAEDYVSTIAGTKGAYEAQIDGRPLESKFHWMTDIDYDGEGGFWIGENWGSSVRKYAIE